MEPRSRNLSPHTSMGHRSFNSLQGFLGTPLRDGVSSIKGNNRWLDVQYVDRGSDVTFVAFHAAVAETKNEYPVFAGIQLAEALDVNYLGIADPACGSAESLKTFWYLSTRRVDAQTIIPAVVKHALHTRSGTHLIFFGASAGGYAALNYSAKFKGSAVFVMNPRIELRAKPDHFPMYAESTYPGWSLERVEGLVPTSMSRLYSKPQGNTVVYLQNSQDSTFFENHYVRFMEASAGRRDVFVMSRPWGKGHVVPTRSVYQSYLLNMVGKAPNWSQALQDGFVRPPSLTPNTRFAATAE